MASRFTFWSSLLLGMGMMAIAGCQSDSLSSQALNPSPVATMAPATESPQSAERASANSAVSSHNSKGIPITIYQSDAQCQDFVSQQISVPKSQPLEAAIGEVLDQTNNGDFEISGYRVNVNSKTRVATIDLRLPSKSSRNFASLSSCEKFALFGSLRRTVVANQVWQVRDVKFTNQGQEILF